MVKGRKTAKDSLQMEGKSVRLKLIMPSGVTINEICRIYIVVHHYLV